MRENFIKYLEKIPGFIVKFCVFSLVLWFLPLTSEYFEFNKQLILRLAMPSALFLWLIGRAVRGSVKISANALNLPIIIFLILTFLSALAGADAFSSFFGSYGRFSDAWLGLLSLAIFYFFLVNSDLADTCEKIFALIRLFFYSAVVAAVVSLSAIFGATRMFASDQFDILASRSFNTVGGSLQILAVFLSIMSVIAAGFLFFGILKKTDKIIFSAGLVLFLFVLWIANFHLAWIISIFGICVLVILRFFQIMPDFKKILNYYLLVPSVVVLLAVFCLIVPESWPAENVLGGKLPKEVLLGHKTSFLITAKSVVENPILGTGPASFARNFSLYRPAELNKSDYWQIRFDKSSSQFLEIAATAGLPAALSLLLIISVVVYMSAVLFYKCLKDRRQCAGGMDYGLISAISAAFAMIFFFQMFFSANTVLNFSFWFFAALIICFWRASNQFLFKEKIFDLKKTVLFSKLLSLVLFFALFSWIALAAFEIRFFAAELFAASEQNNGEKLLKAARLNPYQPHYGVKLAKFYLNAALAESAKPVSAQNRDFIQSNISKSIQAGRFAAEAAPDSVRAQETSGMIYRDVRQISSGSEIWAERFFSRAFALEPTNPALACELAKAYLNNNDIAAAERYFIKSTELKPDYYEAKLGLARTYLKMKKDSAAFNLLNELAAEIYDQEIFYELGRFYYNHGEIDKAIGRFELILSSSPDHSNSLYSMGAAYEIKGDIEKAAEYYGKALKFNPENEDIKNKIKNLKK